jgi:hypothetical protein
LTEQYASINREWQVESETCYESEDEENPSKRELAEDGVFPYSGSVYS